MLKRLYIVSKTLILTILLLCCFNIAKIYATHLAAADLYVDYVGAGPGDLRYKISLIVYRACENGMQMDSVQEIDISASCGIAANTYALTLQADTLGNNTGNVAGHFCPGIASACDSLSSIWTVYRKYIYTAIDTLPAQCSDWTFSWTNCCRNCGITNMANACGYSMYISCQLNNVFKCNISTPRFLSEAIDYKSINLQTVFSNNAIDPDGDNIVVSASYPLQGDNISIPYTPGLSSSDPIGSATGYNLNASSGQVSFTPNAFGKYVCSFHCDKYDLQTNTYLGYTNRDVQIYVVAGSALPPVIDSTPANLTGAIALTNLSNVLQVAYGDTVRFNVRTYSQPISDPVYLFMDAGTATGATFTVPNNGLGTDTGTFSWLPSFSDIGGHYVLFRSTDSNCSTSQPLFLSSYLMVELRVVLPAFNFCASMPVGGSLDTCDIGTFSIGNHTFFAPGPHLNNPMAVNAYENTMDTVTLETDSTYLISATEAIRTNNEADAKLTLFIDYNRNNGFDIPGELAWVAYLYPGHDTAKMAFTAPPNVKLNHQCLARLILNNDISNSTASDDACGFYTSGETKDFLIVFKNASAEVSTFENKYSFSISPNPTKGKFILKGYSPDKTKISISSTIGQLIFDHEYQSVNKQVSTELDLSDYAKGLYFVVVNADGYSQTLKIIKE